MRLRRILWRDHERTITRDRYDWKCGLEANGARVAAWMLTWTITYPEARS
jgi:hypothetical protein